MIEPAIIASLGKDSKVSIYSYGDDSYYDAEIKDVDDSKLENFQADFQSGMIEWIDIRRFKFNVLNPSNMNLPTSSAESNIPVLGSKNESTATETNEPHNNGIDQATQTTPVDVPSTAAAAPSTAVAVPSPVPSSTNKHTASSPDVNGTKTENSAPKIDISRSSGPVPSNIAYVDRGTVIAIRWKRPYILYDATVVKMKDDGSQYLLQYHYDSCTKWVDLRKSEFYIIGVDSTFSALNDDNAPARATRRARKSEEPSEEPTRKRRRAAVAVVEDSKPEAQEETVIQTVNEREMSGFQAEAVGQLSVGSRIAIWTRHKEYRKATIQSFDKAREEFEIHYDTDKQLRKLHLRQNPFLILSPVDGDTTHELPLPQELQDHVNPDLSLVDVGTRISVLWEGDRQFYPGTIEEKKEGSDVMYFLHYDDDDTEWIDLSKHKFKIEEPTTS